MSAINLEIEGSVATVTLNRPEIHNAFDDHMIEELLSVFLDLEQNKAVQIIVLKGAGKNFCAGADLNWMKKTASYAYDQNFADAQRLALLMQTINQIPKLVISVVQGAVFGGGLGLVAASDIVLADESAIFCLSEVRLGLVPAAIGPFVMSAIGARNARRYFLTAERFSAVQAETMGLVHEVISAEDQQDRVGEIIDQALTASPMAQSAAKGLILEIQYQPYSSEIADKTAHAISKARASSHGQEGIAAFFEKRPASWIKE